MKPKKKPAQFKPYYKVVENIIRKNPETNTEETLAHTAVIKKANLLLAREAAWNYMVDRILELERTKPDNKVAEILNQSKKREKAGGEGYDDVTYLDLYVTMKVLHRVDYSEHKDAGKDKYTPEYKGPKLLKGDNVITTIYIVKEGGHGKPTDAWWPRPESNWYQKFRSGTSMKYTSLSKLLKQKLSKCSATTADSAKRGPIL